MPKEIARSVWVDLLRDGKPHDMISFIWERIMENNTLTAFFLMLWTLTLRFLLAAFYFTLLYYGITVLKKCLNKKLSARMKYDCRYILLFGVVLENLPFSNRVMALPSYFLHILDLHGCKSYAFFAVCLLSVVWLVIVIFKLTAHARMNRKIKKTMKRMERYDDNEGLAERAVYELGLRRKPDIMIACYIETPVSYGFFKKTVLLPDDYEEKYSPVELYLLLLHEMTHIKHGDTVKLYIMSLAECFLWITPAMRLFVKSFKRDAEILCDNRVIGLQRGERDTYGNLILKECAYKTAYFGFGFSDTYHAVENRLDALYRYKEDKRLKLLAFVPAAVFIICALSFVFRADWLILNDEYNSEFQFAVYDSETDKYVSLSPEVGAELYEIEDGKIYFHELPARALISSYAADGNIVITARSDNYTVQLGETDVSFGYHGGFAISGEEELSINTSDFDFLNRRTPAEYLFLLITSKL